MAGCWPPGRAWTAECVETVGATEPTIGRCIYFRDPRSHVLELAVNPGAPEIMHKLEGVAWNLHGEWMRTKKAFHRPAWVHGGSYSARA